MKQVVRGAVVQAAAITLNSAATTDKACDLIREAGRNSAEVVVFSECFISAYPAWFQFLPASSPELNELNMRLYKSAIEVPGPETAKLGEAAKNANCYVVIGVCERSRTNSGSMFNTQLFFGPDGQLLGKHQKLTPTGYERMVHWGGWGDTLTVIDTPFGPLSALACSENSNPLAGFDIITRGPRIHAMSWPPHFIMAGKGPPLPDVSLLTARHFTLMSKAFVLSACGVIDHDFYKELAKIAGRPEEDLAAGIADGGSAIISPGSEVIAGPLASGVEGILYADLDLDLWVKAKMLQDFAGHYNRPDVFTLEVDRKGGRYEDPNWGRTPPNRTCGERVRRDTMRRRTRSRQLGSSVVVAASLPWHPLRSCGGKDAEVPAGRRARASSGAGCIGTSDAAVQSSKTMGPAILVESTRASCSVANVFAETIISPVSRRMICQPKGAEDGPERVMRTRYRL